MSRDQGSFLPIICQESILPLRHVVWFGISVQKYVYLIQPQLPGALSETSRILSVQWFSTLDTIEPPQSWIWAISGNSNF